MICALQQSLRLLMLSDALLVNYLKIVLTQKIGAILLFARTAVGNLKLNLKQKNNYEKNFM